MVKNIWITCRYLSYFLQMLLEIRRLSMLLISLAEAQYSSPWRSDMVWV